MFEREGDDFQSLTCKTVKWKTTLDSSYDKLTCNMQLYNIHRNVSL